MGLPHNDSDTGTDTDRDARVGAHAGSEPGPGAGAAAGARARAVFDADRGVDDMVDRALRRLADKGRDRGPRAAVIADAARDAATGGKRFRPRLVASSHLAFGGGAPNDAVADVAAGFELLHTAFVIHDDVIDGDVERRGKPNVSGVFRAGARAAGASYGRAARFGDAASILTGDVLLYEATRLIAGARLPADPHRRLLDLLDDVILVSAAGELADVEYATLPTPPSPEAVLATARDKTAVYSISAPLQAGALIAGAPDDAVAALGAAGRSLGLAFQLADDLIGAFGTAGQAGRSPGADLREGKHTALIALARRSDEWSEVEPVLAMARSGTEGVHAAQAALDACGARKRVSALIDETLAAARDRWSRAPIPEAARRMLGDLTDVIEERVP
ncbi:geranylgeranyl diphosphate synthase, type II [Glycomyces sambucus]|uniref:Geranylgeranyl diphosphate synthase, type II n=1 Tax=Glycomyces sambucus TaxID=380244 RepID=A0A1G9I304_9ACTN|nr:polyprenyl synthetase family protein [Glycomyces sambucus]SDL19611.1 geranylgeranyl diphosphate synthase, type II [Glycomyces sambucus]